MCKAYETFYRNEPPIPSQYLADMLRLILKENPFQFVGKKLPPSTRYGYGGKKWKLHLLTSLCPQQREKLLTKVRINHQCGRDLSMTYSHCGIQTKKKYDHSGIELANNHHPTIKFTAEVSNTETVFQDTCIYKGERFKTESILEVRTLFKPTETFQYTHFSSCHPIGVKKGFIKGEALRLLRTNSSEKTFEEDIINFKRRLRMRGYTDKLIDKNLLEVKHHERMSALQNKTKTHKKILPFVTEHRPSGSVPSIP